MKLEDIKKKNIYTVPDKYFDQLPTRIQSKVNEKKPVSWFSWDWKLSYKVAMPAIAVVLFVLFLVKPDSNINQDPGTLLAEVSTEDIIAYLEFTDVTTDEIIESVDLDDLDLNFYEDGPIIQEFNDINEEDLDYLLEKYDLMDDVL